MAKKKETRGERLESVEELTQHLQRLQAEFDNFRRRTEEDRSRFIDIAKEEIIKDLLPLLDNLERATGHLPQELKENEWAKGIAQISKQTEQTFRNLGITRIPTVGEAFDPHFHEAVVSDGGETITEELQSGWQLGEKVIRHAMVKLGGAHPELDSGSSKEEIPDQVRNDKRKEKNNGKDNRNRFRND